ncbi:MAG: tRNA uridine-5-carboxymethylaminomethyl(34) synthesis GTPase MnmE [Halioglobus sp.]
MVKDTITAIATAPGRGGVGIVRVSGEKALAIGESLTRNQLTPRNARFVSVFDQEGAILDQGLCIFFQGPHSFTGEDVVEFQVHGGPVILDMVLRETRRAGARLARPGEFSERAFLNDKLDLAQAEAIADMINSTTEQAARNASRSLQGDFSREVDKLVELVTELRIYTEAAIDFPEEEIDFLHDEQVTRRLDAITGQFAQLKSATEQGTLLQEGMKLVIMGKPNAGKSSLLNALSGRDAAIVTAIEGTTRDVLRESIHIDGLPLHIVDTAGLRDSPDEIEQEGIRRAWQEVETADHIILVVDSTTVESTSAHDPLSFWPPGQDPLPANTPVTVILNKSDLVPCAAGVETQYGSTLIRLSATSGEGMDLLRDHLKRSIGYAGTTEGSFSARRRHMEAIATAETFLLNDRSQLESNGAGELLAEDLRQCQQALGEITGKVTSDDLLGKIFSSFCIGK